MSTTFNFIDHNLNIESVDEIIPGLWLGNEAVSQSEKFVKNNNIRLIVNASKNIPSKFLGKIHYMRIPVDDPGISGKLGGVSNPDVFVMKESLPFVLAIIHKFRKKQQPILIHCHAGAQRSAIIAAAYILHCGYAHTPDEAINKIIKKREIAFFGGKSVNFRDVFS
jgi:hypothetical protein